LIATTFGHALLATEDPTHYDEARKVLKIAVQRDNQNPDAWYQLGQIYDHEGDQARASLATAERYSLEGNPKMALRPAEMAMAGIPRGTPDWIRAQDIAMVSKAAMEDQKGKKRK
jgi:predicted Zn-dependent protease